jgi:hypothetical protein
MTNPTELLASASSAALRVPPTVKKSSDRKATKPATPKKLTTTTRFGKLDGKPRSRPRGRNAVARSDLSDDDGDAEREIVTIPVNQRLGFRIAEFAALLGVSHVTIWRGIKAGKIDFIDQNGVKIIPRAFAIKAGYITADDTI